MDDKIRANLNRLIADYRLNSRLVRDDLNQKMNAPNNERIEERILSVDFSELFAYSFYSKKMQKDYKLLDTIFTSKYKIDRDCKLVLAPPAIFELIEYYNSARNLLNRFRNFEDVLRIPEANKFYMDYKKYQNIKFDSGNPGYTEALKNVLNSYESLKNYGNTEDRNIGSLAFVLQISTPGAQESIINEPYRRLTELIDNRTIIPLEDAVDDPGRIRNLKTDRVISQLIFEKLQRKRELKEKNNLVDADLAGLCAGFNQEFKKDKIAMNIFSGSYRPNRVMYDCSNQIKMVIPRCPMYTLIRMFLFKKFKGDYGEMLDYANPLSTSFENMTNFNDIFLNITRKINKTNIFNIDEHNFYVKSLNAAYYSMRLLFYDYDLGDDLIKASRDLSFDEMLKSKLETLIEDKDRDLNFFNGINSQDGIDGAANWDMNEANASFEKARDDLENYTERLYIILFDYVKAYDFNRLSLRMYDDYNYMINKFIN